MQIVVGDPSSRIESWIIQIEWLAQKAIAELEPKIAASWKGVHAAHSRRDRLEALAKRTRNPKDIAAAERALRDENRALERAQPDAWFAARNALREVQLLRRAAAEGKLEEAVEATFGAMNAAWKLTGEQIEPVVQAGVKARDAAARGGKARAARRGSEWKQQADAIRKAHQQMVASREKSPALIRSGLMERFGLSGRTIDRALETRTKQPSHSLSTVAPGSADDVLTHEDNSQPRKARKAPA